MGRRKKKYQLYDNIEEAKKLAVTPPFQKGYCFTVLSCKSKTYKSIKITLFVITSPKKSWNS